MGSVSVTTVDGLCRVTLSPNRCFLRATFPVQMHPDEGVGRDGNIDLGAPSAFPGSARAKYFEVTQLHSVRACPAPLRPALDIALKAAYDRWTPDGSPPDVPPGLAGLTTTALDGAGEEAHGGWSGHGQQQGGEQGQAQAFGVWLN